MKNKKIIIIIGFIMVIVVVIGALLWWSGEKTAKKTTITESTVDTSVEVLPQTKTRGDWLYTTRQIGLGAQKITALIADTPEKRERGLGLYGPLKGDEGMLFVFEASSLYSFWMKDMTFAIDIIWLDETGKIVDIKEQISPEKPTKIFTNQVPAKYVLELLAGEGHKNNLQVGSQIGL